MPPPPIPIDPALDSFRNSTVSLSHSIGLDHFLPPGPVLQDRLAFSRSASHIDTLSQDVQLPSMKQSTDLDTIPIYRFCSDAGPWNSQHIASDVNQLNMASRYQGSYVRFNQLPMLSSSYREPPRSEVGSSTTGRNQHDSGYGTRSYTTKSVRSAEPFDQSQSCQSLAGDVNDTQIYPDERFQTQAPEIAQEIPYSFDYSSDAPAEQPPPFICPHAECGNLELKNQSEWR